MTRPIRKPAAPCDFEFKTTNQALLPDQKGILSGVSVRLLTYVRRPVAAIAMAAVATSGCTSMRQYEGPERPANQIAVLTKPKGTGAVINSIDGKFRGIGDLERHEFLPGSHTLLVHFVSAATGALRFSADPLRLTFDAQPGSTYTLIARSDPGERQWTAWIEDAATKEIVAKPER